jgi:hypothetical protein
MTKEIQGGENASITYIANYNSPLSLNNSNVSFYLSTDSAFNKTEDTLLYKDYIYWYSSNRYTETNSIQIPSNKFGNYYILCVIDPENTVSETNENNNFIGFPVKISKPCYDVELLSSSIFYTSTNNNIQVSLLCRNAGNVYMESTEAGFYLSDDSTYDINDRLLTYQSIYTLYPGSTKSSQSSIYVNNIEVNNKYLITRLDYNNKFSETNEKNNYHVNLISELTNITDFQYRKKKTIVANSGFIRDNGGNSYYSNSSSDTIVIVPKTKGKQIALYVNSFNVEYSYDKLMIYDGIFSDSTTPKYIANITYNGTSYISSDNSGAISLVFTSNESTNYSGFELLFDTVKKSSSEKDIDLQQFSLNGNSFVKNEYVTGIGSYLLKGIESYTYVDYGIFLSNDSVLDINDALLTTYSLYNYSSSQSFSYSFYLPSNVNTGTYYIICKTDYSNAYSESNEKNNIKHYKIQIVKSSMDLYINNPGIAGIVFKNVQSNFQLNIMKNGSIDTSGYITTKLYFSKDKFIDSGDSIPSTYDNYIYGTSSSYMYSYLNFTLNNSINNGSYYLIAVVNEGFVFREIDSTNNTLSIPIIITKEENDLSILSCVLGDSVVTNGEIYNNIKIKNLGKTRSDRFTIKSYLSKDKVLDKNDKIINNYSYSTVIQAFETISLSQSYYASFDNTGQFYIITKVFDDNNNINDVDTTNNVFINSVTVKLAKAEVYPSFASSDSILTPGNYWYPMYYVNNDGPEYCTNSTLKLYLSRDNNIDSTDILIGERYNLSVYSYSSVTTSFSYYVPTNIGKGRYYAIVQLTSPSDVDTTNNILSFQVRVPYSQNNFDLGIDNFSLDGNPSALKPNSFVYGKYSITNFGLYTCSGFTAGLYLSADSILDSSDKLLWSKFLDGLNTCSTIEDTLGFKVPSYIPTKGVYLIIKTDINNVVNDNITTNNIIKIHLLKAISGINLNTQNFTMYPNPVVNKLFITPKTESKYIVRIISPKGDVVLNEIFDKLNYINMEKFNSGVYVLIIQDAKTEETYNYKIIKK